MTWYFDIKDVEVDVYDHEGVVVDSFEYGDGIDFPTDIYSVMITQIDEEYAANGFNDYVFECFKDAIFGRIEQGTP